MIHKLPKPSFDLLHAIVNDVKTDSPHISELSDEIHKFYIDQIQTDEIARKRELCLQKLREYLNSSRMVTQFQAQGFKIEALTLFGSFATHCASKDSDLDLCVCASFKGKQKPMPVVILQIIHQDLVLNAGSETTFGANVHNITFVPSARVPIIRFTIDCVSIDMSASFDKTPPRTSLAAKYINAYCQLDERFKELVTFLKYWLKSEGSDSTHLREFPNSYSLILMLIHVLQWYGVMPNLHQTHKDMFNLNHFKSWELTDIGQEFKFPLDENTVKIYRKRHTKNYSVVQLLYLFACQYSEDSIMIGHRFNMKTGDIESRSEKDRPLTIIDTYDVRNPGRTVRNVFEVMGALKALRELFAKPSQDMFSQLLRITQNKKYSLPVYPSPADRQFANNNRQMPRRVQPQPRAERRFQNQFFQHPMNFPMHHPVYSPVPIHGYPGPQALNFGQFPFSNLRISNHFEEHAHDYNSRFQYF